MYNNEKIGVGIVTYNRKESFNNLFKLIINNNVIDTIVVVKNKDIDYNSYLDLTQFDNVKSFYFNVKDDLGVGFCKNKCMTTLLDLLCQHIFIIEDDIEILNNDVFLEFIKTSKHFNIGHLNWNTLLNVENNPTYTVSDNDFLMDISFKLCGCFSYFSRYALQYCGLIDDKRFINALEHAEHAYRMSLHLFAPPFFAFPGIHAGYKYLKEISKSSTIERNSNIYEQRLANAFNNFIQLYGRPMSSIKKPTIEDVKQFLAFSINNKIL